VCIRCKRNATLLPDATPLIAGDTRYRINAHALLVLIAER
jgi:hypothetical protein